MHAELDRQRPAGEAVYPNTWGEAEQLDRRSWSRRAATSANREEEQRTVQASRLLPALLLGMVEARAPIN